MIGNPLIEFAFTTTSLILGIALGVIFCCLYIKLSDSLWARRQNISRQSFAAAEKLSHASSLQTSAKAECCTIYVPDVAIVL